MIKFAFILAALFTFNLAQAQSFKVVRIQGKKAIVEISDPTMVSVNETYNVGVGSSSSGGGKGSFKRDNAIDFTFSYLSQSNPTYSQMVLGGAYLWNMKSYEFGPELSLTNTTSGGSSTNTTTFGGLGYYNFNENKVGVETVMSAVGALSMTSGGGASTTNISLGGNYRWFLLSGDHCLSFSALYRMVQASGTSVSGFVLQGGIATYF